MDKKILDKFDYGNEIPLKTENQGVSAKESLFRRDFNPSRIYFEQLLCLLLLGGISFWNSGPRVAVMALFSLVGAVLMDIIGCALSRKVYDPRDLSTLTAGLCIALLMPAGIDYSLVLFGSALTIGIKHIFGGRNNYIFNPTAAAFVFMLLCYPGKMLLFPKPLEHLPIWGEIVTTSLSNSTSTEFVSTFNIFMGNFTGAMGTVHILVILVAGICLLFRRSVSITVTLSAFAANMLFTGISGGFEDGTGIVRAFLTVMVSGYFLFMLIFLANDPQTLPKTFLGKIYYGVLFGAMIVVFRVYGKVEGEPAFALLLVNTLSERVDTMAQRTKSGVKRSLVFAQARLNSYERIREKAATVDESTIRPNLSDTQEIFIERQNYNMPPLDNKIIKINRKKQGLITRLKEKLGSLSEKRKLAQKDEPEISELNFIENLREGMKELGEVFKKKEVFEEMFTETDDVQETDTQLTPLELMLKIDENDIVEIEDDDSEKESGKKKKKKKAKK